MRNGAIEIAQLHGRYGGAIAALKSVVPIIPDAQLRIDGLRKQYVSDRADQIEVICQRYLEAVVMLREVNLRPGRPRLRLPDYAVLQEPNNPKEARKIVQYAFEFAIAVKLAETKENTGRYTGLQKLLTDAIERGDLDDTGDVEQRVKRLARQLYEDSLLYLTPGLQAARRGAQLFIYSGE